jgi:16S rRNA U516 pseudouridylate synthase RsuA-like enzyme
VPPRRDDKEATLVITIHEGRNRQVRDMCDAIGHPVEHLRRVAIGPIRDAKLKTGHWRELNEQEVARLRKAARMKAQRGFNTKGHKGQNKTDS